MVAANSIGQCFIWKFNEEESEYEPIQELEAHEDQYILRVKFSSDCSLLATCSSDRSAKVWKRNDETGLYEEKVCLAGH